MSSIFLCKYCGLYINSKQLARHLNKIHGKKYLDYVLENIEDFSSLGWGYCKECGHLFKGRSDKCGQCYTKSHKLEKNQYVKCQICEKDIHSKQMSYHLNHTHQIKFMDYISNHLEDFKRFGWCRCAICKNITRKQGNKHDPTCSRDCRRKIISIEYKGRKGKPCSVETRKKISNFHKKRLSNPENHHFYNTRRSDVDRKKISQTRIERGVAKGKNNPMYGKTHSPESVKKIFAHRKMNKLEKIVADELDKIGIEYIFQYFIVENGICKSYDFKIKGKPLIIEVDGDFWHGNPNIQNHYKKSIDVQLNDRMKEKMAQRRGLKLIRFWESDIKKDPSIVIKYL